MNDCNIYSGKHNEILLQITYSLLLTLVPLVSLPLHVWFRLRRDGGKFLLNKYVLLVIVVLNIIDCALVLGELILDLHHVKGPHKRQVNILMFH